MKDYIKCMIPNCNKNALKISPFCGPHDKAGIPKKSKSKLIIHT